MLTNPILRRFTIKYKTFILLIKYKTYNLLIINLKDILQNIYRIELFLQIF